MIRASEYRNYIYGWHLYHICLYECEKFLYFEKRIEGGGRKCRTRKQARKGRKKDDRGRKEKREERG